MAAGYLTCKGEGRHKMYEVIDHPMGPLVLASNLKSAHPKLVDPIPLGRIPVCPECGAKVSFVIRKDA